MYKIALSRLRPHLLKLGFTQNKTGNEFIPLGVDQTLKHFVRGASDGDGSFSLLRGGYLEWSLVCSGRQFLEDLSKRITDHGHHLSVSKRGDVSSGFWRMRAGHASAVRLGHWLYSDAEICLNRKREKWLQGSAKAVRHSRWTPEELESLANGGTVATRSQAAIACKRWELSLKA
jgi:hypothetical protein